MNTLTKHVVRGVILALFALPVCAQTYTGAPFEATCQNASGSGPVEAGGSVTCTLRSNLSIPQAAPFTVTPVLPAGATITGCATPYPPDMMLAQSGGETLPVFLTIQSPTGKAHTAIGHGLNGLTVPMNSCAFTWLVEAPSDRAPGPPEIAPSGTIIGTETFTVASRIRCGSEIARQAGAQWISNGDFATFASDGNPIASSDVGFGAIVSGGFLQCDRKDKDEESEEEGSRPVVNTGMAAQTSCAFSRGHRGTTATCTVTDNLFLPTGGTLLLSPLTPNGARVTGCSSSTEGIVVNGPGGTLPMATYRLLPFMPHGGTVFTFQSQIGTSTTVPANTCAFTSLGAANPAGIPGDTVVGTETIFLPEDESRCGIELTQSATSYVPNGSSVMWPAEFGGFDTYFPETTAARISGGFLCRSGDSTTLSEFTNTGLPVEFSCATSYHRHAAGGSVTCTITNNVLQYTGNTTFVSPTAPSGGKVTSCSSTTPGVVATGPGRILPIFSQTQGIIVSPPGVIQAGALDGNGNPITTVPDNTCAYTFLGPTPSALEAGKVLGTETVSIRKGSVTRELTQRADVYENVGIAFGFNCSALVTALADSRLCVPPTSRIIAPFLLPVFDREGNIVLGSAGVPEESMQDVYAGTSGTRIQASEGHEHE